MTKNKKNDIIKYKKNKKGEKMKFASPPNYKTYEVCKIVHSYELHVLQDEINVLLEEGFRFRDSICIGKTGYYYQLMVRKVIVKK